tara:strand:+ start:293 stop:517 length:225 start_codon:yes stop_codon:yes gene_type:complete
MEWILFTIGILIGGLMGVTAMSILASGTYSDLDNEIIGLRLQRKMLKEELLKQRPKKRYTGKKPNYKKKYKKQK